MTQKIYDLMLGDKGKLDTPLNPNDVLKSANIAIPELLKDDGVVYELYQGENLNNVLKEVKAITVDESKLKAVLEQASKETEAYYTKYIAKQK